MPGHTLTRPLTRLADGTVKQVNPLTGTEVWTVPGRGHRPLGTAPARRQRLDAAAESRTCAFCPGRYLDTPPEKARLVRTPGGWRTLRNVPAEQLDATVAEFRRIPNLFEILPLDYWQVNHGYQVPAPALAHEREYLAAPAGRAHVLAVVRRRLEAAGMPAAERESLTEAELLARAHGFFAGGHDLVVARRHHVDGAVHDDELASSGTLTPEEHDRYTAFTVETLRSLYEANPYARYVAVYQNWLRPAGASFDHLHKQLVAIDERGRQIDHELTLLRTRPDLYNEAVLDVAVDEGLLVAENDHAVVLAGVGHRYPTLEVWSRSAAGVPWELTTAELRDFSDLLHACHAATGAAVPTNEEWHHRPPDAPRPMPLRAMLKWRVSTLAGFEGGTKINLNTISPHDLRARVVHRLGELRAAGQIAPVRVGDECSARRGSLRYRDTA